MSSPLESAPCKEHLPDVYRFALLMTGNSEAAGEVLRRTVERAARGGIGDLRDTRRARRWLFAEARHHCGGPLAPKPLALVPGGDAPLDEVPPPVPLTPSLPGSDGSAAGDLAGSFVALPERERSALILFYLYQFDPADLAETLELKPETLGPILTHGRALLMRELDKSPLVTADHRDDRG